jgi:hypothetical protein
VPKPVNDKSFSNLFQFLYIILLFKIIVALKIANYWIIDIERIAFKKIVIEVLIVNKLEEY